MSNKNKVALITGITGQDGSYLADLLSKKGMKFMVLKEDLVVLILPELMTYIKIHMTKIKNFIYIMEI